MKLGPNYYKEKRQMLISKKGKNAKYFANIISKTLYKKNNIQVSKCYISNSEEILQDIYNLRGEKRYMHFREIQLLDARKFGHMCTLIMLFGKSRRQIFYPRICASGPLGAQSLRFGDDGNTSEVSCDEATEDMPPVRRHPRSPFAQLVSPACLVFRARVCILPARQYGNTRAEFKTWRKMQLSVGKSQRQIFYPRICTSGPVGVP